MLGALLLTAIIQVSCRYKRDDKKPRNDRTQVLHRADSPALCVCAMSDKIIRRKSTASQHKKDGGPNRKDYDVIHSGQSVEERGQGIIAAVTASRVTHSACLLL